MVITKPIDLGTLTDEAYVKTYRVILTDTNNWNTYLHFEIEYRKCEAIIDDAPNLLSEKLDIYKHAFGEKQKIGTVEFKEDSKEKHAYHKGRAYAQPLNERLDQEMNTMLSSHKKELKDIGENFIPKAKALWLYAISKD